MKCPIHNFLGQARQQTLKEISAHPKWFIQVPGEWIWYIHWEIYKQSRISLLKYSNGIGNSNIWFIFLDYPKSEIHGFVAQYFSQWIDGASHVTLFILSHSLGFCGLLLTRCTSNTDKPEWCWYEWYLLHIFGNV